jgi:hypothetical protein
MLDDGQVQSRTRLVRPMTRETLSTDDFARSHWREAAEARFAALWQAECAKVPEFADSEFHIITGLLLPIWDRLPSRNMRVYRFETDDGERVIGRLVAPEELGRLYQSLGSEAPPLSAAEAWSAVLDRGAVIELAGGLQLRRSLNMGAQRIELTGFSEGGTVSILKSLGLVSEIVAWRLRLFVPVSEDGPAILAALLARNPLIAVRLRADAA